jgi:hypothetical protein
MPRLVNRQHLESFFRNHLTCPAASLYCQPVRDWRGTRPRPFARQCLCRSHRPVSGGGRCLCRPNPYVPSSLDRRAGCAVTGPVSALCPPVTERGCLARPREIVGATFGIGLASLFLFLDGSR